MQRQQKRFDKKLVFLTMLVLFACVTPAQIVHEYGHAIVCSAKGGTFDMSIDALGAYLVCQGDVQDNLFFRVFGGGLASLVFISPLVIRGIRERVWLLIPLASISVGHLVNALVETFAYESYISGDPIWSAVMMASSYAVFIGLMIRYGRKPVCAE